MSLSSRAILPSVSMCMSVCCSYKGANYIGLGPTLTECDHLNLIKSAETRFSNKVTFTGTVV